MSNNILDHEEVSEVTSRRARWLSPNAARPDSREESASGGEKSGGGGLGGAVASGIAGGVAHAIAGAVIDGALGSGGGGGSGRGRRGGDGDAPEPPPFLVNLYKRIQHKIDKENPLIQNRLSSLLTSETIYLGAMGAIFALICANQVRSEVEMLLKWILFSLSTWVVGHTWNAHRLVRAACVTIDRLYDDWDTEVRDKDKISGNLAKDKWAGRIWVELKKEPIKLSPFGFGESTREALYVYVRDREDNHYLVFPPMLGKFSKIDLTRPILMKFVFNVLCCGCLLSLPTIFKSFRLTSFSTTIALDGATSNAPVKISSVAPATNYTYGLITNIVASNAPVTIWGVFTNELKGVVTNTFDDKAILKISPIGPMTNELRGTISNVVVSNGHLNVSIDGTVEHQVSVPDEIRTRVAGELNLVEHGTNSPAPSSPKRKTTSGISILIGHQSETEGKTSTSTSPPPR